MKQLSSFTLCPINGHRVSDKDNALKPSEQNSFKSIKSGSPPLNRNHFSDVSNCRPPALRPVLAGHSGFRASPFEPMVHQRKLPSYGAISPLESAEFRAWKSLPDDESRFEELSDATAQQCRSDQQNDLVGLVVETRQLPDTWPVSDNGVSPEESLNSWKERFFQSEVARTQTRLDVMRLLEENRRLRIKIIALEAELHEEQRNRSALQREACSPPVANDLEISTRNRRSSCTAKTETCTDASCQSGSLQQCVETEKGPENPQMHSAKSKTMNELRSERLPTTDSTHRSSMQMMTPYRSFEFTSEAKHSNVLTDANQEVGTVNVKDDGSRETYSPDHNDPLHVKDGHGCDQRQKSEIKDIETCNANECVQSTNLEPLDPSSLDLLPSGSDDKDRIDEMQTEIGTKPPGLMYAASSQNFNKDTGSTAIESGDDYAEKELASAHKEVSPQLKVDDSEIDHRDPMRLSGDGKVERSASTPTVLEATRGSTQETAVPKVDIVTNSTESMKDSADDGLSQSKEEESSEVSDCHSSSISVTGITNSEPTENTSPSKSEDKSQSSLKPDVSIKCILSEASNTFDNRRQEEPELSRCENSPQQSDSASFLSHVNSRRGGGRVAYSPGNESFSGLLSLDTNRGNMNTNPLSLSPDTESEHIDEDKPTEADDSSPSPPARMTRSRYRQENNLKPSPSPRRSARRGVKQLQENGASTGPMSGTKDSTTDTAIPDVFSPSNSANESLKSIQVHTDNLSLSKKVERKGGTNPVTMDCQNDSSTEGQDENAPNGVETRSMGVSTRSNSSFPKIDKGKKKTKRVKRKRSGDKLLESFQAPSLKNRRRRRRY